MMPPLRSFDDVDERKRGQKKTDDLRAMTTLGPRTLLQSIRPGPSIVCNDQLYRARVIVFFTVDVGHFNLSMKMQASLKHGSCFGELGCKTPQQLFNLSNSVLARKIEHVSCIGEAE